MTTQDILNEFDSKYNHDDPNGKALVLIESHEGGTSQRPVQDEIREFIISALVRQKEEIIQEMKRKKRYGR